jgi:hypothetical protein
LPTALLICAGWLEWLQMLAERLHIPYSVMHPIPIEIMIALSIFTLFNIVKYLHPSVVNIQWLIFLAALLYLAVRVVMGTADRLNTQSR